MDRKASGACGAEGRCICSRQGDGSAEACDICHVREPADKIYADTDGPTARDFLAAVHEGRRRRGYFNLIFGALGGTIGAIPMVFFINRERKYYCIVLGFLVMLISQISFILYMISVGYFEDG